MGNPFLPPLRTHLELWEHEAADHWQTIIRSPHILHRVGIQINQTLETQQRIRNAVEQLRPDHVATYKDLTRMLYLLERVQAQLNALETRIDRLENKRS